MQDCLPGTSSVSPKWSVTMLDRLLRTTMQDLHHDDDEKRQIEPPTCFDESQLEPEGLVTMQDRLPTQPLEEM